MSPCLSDNALTRVHADLGSIAERAHLAACGECTARSRQMRRDLDLIAAVLRDTREPTTRPAPVRAQRGWLPAAVGLSAAAALLLVWV
jgi:hypothetical protein